MSAVKKFEARYRNSNADIALKSHVDLMQSNVDWVDALRQRGVMSVSEMGLPTQKLERWKYTNLPAKLKKMDLVLAKTGYIYSGNQNGVTPFDGDFKDILEWGQKTLERDPPANEQYGDQMLWQNGNAYLNDGFILDVPKNTNETNAFEVSFTGQIGAQTSPRQIIRVGENASFTLIENQTGEGAYWSNIVTQIELASGAKFYHYRFQNNSNEAVITHNTHIIMADNAEYEAFTLTDGAGLSRNQVHVDMNGAQSTCSLNGINILNGTQLADTTITVDHCAPYCNSFQNYRNVVDDKSTSVFQGKVHVHQIAQKTDGYQMAKSLLLSPESTVNTKPELEIYADDVKCSHGATTGQMDKEALFYLQSRGIPMAQAKALLIEAFISEVTEEISNEAVQEKANEIVSRWLAKT